MREKNKSDFILPTAERTLWIHVGPNVEFIRYWRRRGVWGFSDATPKLEFLSATPIEQIEDTVTKLGWRWKWHNPSDDKIMKRSVEYKRKYGGVF